MSSRPEVMFCSVLNIADGSASPQEAYDHAKQGSYGVFWTEDAAQRMRGEHTRREEVIPCNKIEYPRQDAVITYSHDDGCFYVAQLPQASATSPAQANASSPISVYLVKEGNVPFKQLSPDIRSCSRQHDSRRGTA